MNSISIYENIRAKTYQNGDWRHVERAAPIPVPVQKRTPRLYSVEVLDTPANFKHKLHGKEFNQKVIPSTHGSRGSSVDFGPGYV